MVLKRLAKKHPHLKTKIMSDENRMTVCSACDSFCNRIELDLDPNMGFKQMVEEAYRQKKRAILAKRKEFKEFWKSNVCSKIKCC